MKRQHFEAFRPICPVCRAQTPSRMSPLTISQVARGSEDVIREGILLCSDAGCQREYPVIDGIPLIFAGLRDWIASNIQQIRARDDVSELIESLLGDCCGPQSAFDTVRQHLSSYVRDHYGDLDPQESPQGPDTAEPGSVLRLLDACLQVAGPGDDGPILDLGCGPGRTSFALAQQTRGLVLGVDLNYPMLRTATRVLRDRIVSYPRRRVGLVYDRREFAVELPDTERVDFWACDAAALPFADNTFRQTIGLNLVDCAQDPLGLLQSLARVTSSGGRIVMACPYDWSTGATPVERWLGGHSQRSPLRGDSATLLRSLMTPGAHPAAIDGLRIVAERDGLPWQVRLHERSTMQYSVDLLVAAVD